MATLLVGHGIFYSVDKPNRGTIPPSLVLAAKLLPPCMLNQASPEGDKGRRATGKARMRMAKALSMPAHL